MEVTETEWYKSFKRMNGFIENNCLKCNKGNYIEGYKPGDPLYCNIVQALESRIGWLHDERLSMRMRVRMDYPEGPCREIIREEG